MPSINTTRRGVLKLLGTATITPVGIVRAAEPASAGRVRIRKLGHSLLSDPPGGFAEVEIRTDGRFGLIGSYGGPGGTFLVDLADPHEPTEVHHVPSPSDATRHADVKFDHRDGLYYRTKERTNVDDDPAPEGEAGVDVIDYGFDDATAADPEIIATLAASDTHNVFAHPDEPLVYAVNETNGTSALEIWDVDDPAEPTLIRDDIGPTGALHDIVVDGERELAHAAFISDAFDDFDPERNFAGYLLYDVRDPRDPSVVGTFDYTDHRNYTQVGEAGFENAHYADFDPRRALAIVGDETGTGVPGGKHVFDITDPTDPTPVGFTTSPNAERQNEADELFDWTTHNHDVVPKGDSTLLVSGDYHEGVVVYDITDPTDPTPTHQYRTRDKAGQANGPILLDLGDPPMAWGANYNAERDVVVASDMFTGFYTFEVTADGYPTNGDR